MRSLIILSAFAAVAYQAGKEVEQTKNRRGWWEAWL